MTGRAGLEAPGALPVPRYDERSLAELLPSVLRALGAGDEPAALSLPPVRRACVLLVDGLGLHLLREHADVAPFLASLLESTSGPASQGLTSVFPTTTAASLTSLGTGVPPGLHGLVGFEVYLPDLDRVLNCLRWDPDIDARSVQPLPTVFEQAVQAGIAVSSIGPAAFEGSGLTEAAMRGGEHLGAETAGERVAAAEYALAPSGPSLVYVYYGDLDATGHRYGCRSSAWRYQLAHVDRFAEQLAALLPADAMLVVTADHGMVDVPFEARWDLASEPHLGESVRVLSGEPRALHVHTVAGAEIAVLEAWRATLGDAAWVLGRDEAVAAGLFGPSVRDAVRPRIGDVVVAAREPVAVVDSRRMSPQMLGLVGVHGSLTEAELLVPLLVATG